MEYCPSSAVVIVLSQPFFSAWYIVWRSHLHRVSLHLTEKEMGVFKKVASGIRVSQTLRKAFTRVVESVYRGIM